MRLRDVSLRSKLIGIILATTTCSLALGFALVIVNDVRTFRAEAVGEALLVARVMGDSSVSDLAFRDEIGSRETLARLQSVPTVRAAHVFDEDGRLFASWGRGEPTGPHELLEPGALLRGGLLHVNEPIVYRERRYGHIHLCASTQALDAKIRSHLLTMGGLLGLLILLSVLAARRLERVISGPILDLGHAARRISEEHDYTLRVQKSGDDEIGRLCDDFNEMLAQIQRRERERDEADARTREKSLFLANMSHELRTPLNSIIGFSEVLLGRLEGRLLEHEQRFLSHVHNSGQHLLGVVNDILDLSKVEAGKMEVHVEQVSVRAAIDGVCAVVRGMSSRKSIAFEIEAAEDLPALEADPVRLKQVLYNLLSNAVKFSPEGSQVRIEARRVPAETSALHVEAVELAVRDCGIGIDPAHHELIFREFKQVDSGLGHKEEGTGLGLSLVKKFVELHGGQVGVESVVGRGSVFRVLLPVAFAGAGGAGAPAPGTAAAEARQVLVIEADAGAYDEMQRHLRAAAYEPHQARSADEGVRLAKELRPSAITLDVVLPGRDGLEVVKRLKGDEATRSIPVIVVSEDASREVVVALGADDHFLKPVDYALLITRLRKLAPPEARDPRSPTGA